MIIVGRVKSPLHIRIQWQMNKMRKKNVLKINKTNSAVKKIDKLIIVHCWLMMRLNGWKQFESMFTGRFGKCGVMHASTHTHIHKHMHSIPMCSSSFVDSEINHLTAFNCQLNMQCNTRIQHPTIVDFSTIFLINHLSMHKLASSCAVSISSCCFCCDDICDFLLLRP